MYQPISEIKLTPEQAEVELRLCEALGLDPHTVRVGTFEAMALADDTVRVRWTGMMNVPRKDFLEAAPDAVIV